GSTCAICARPAYKAAKALHRSVNERFGFKLEDDDAGTAVLDAAAPDERIVASGVKRPREGDIEQIELETKSVSKRPRQRRRSTRSLMTAIFIDMDFIDKTLPCIYSNYEWLVLCRFCSRASPSGSSSALRFVPPALVASAPSIVCTHCWKSDG